jgi:hypothetical protein
VSLIVSTKGWRERVEHRLGRQGYRPGWWREPRWIAISRVAIDVEWVWVSPCGGLGLEGSEWTIGSCLRSIEDETLSSYSTRESLVSFWFVSMVPTLALFQDFVVFVD